MKNLPFLVLTYLVTSKLVKTKQKIFSKFSRPSQNIQTLPKHFFSSQILRQTKLSQSLHQTVFILKMDGIFADLPRAASSKGCGPTGPVCPADTMGPKNFITAIFQKNP